MHLHPYISYTSVFGNRYFFDQIHIMDAIFMKYWVAVQMRTMMSSVMYNIKLRIGYMTLRRALMIPCEMFLREHLSVIRRIALLVSGRVRVDGRGDAISHVPFPGLLVPWEYRLNWDRKAWTSFWSLIARRPDLKSLVRVSLFFLSPLLDE